MIFAFLHFLTGFSLGATLIRYFMPAFLTIGTRHLKYGVVAVSSIIIVGMFVQTMAVYVLAVLFTTVGVEGPLLWSNVVVLSVGGALTAKIARETFPVNRTEVWRAVRDRFGWRELAVTMSCIFFSLLLMSRTVSSDGETLLFGRNVIGDFNAHIPLIRSFSMGQNFPAEYPFYAGPGIRYHFLYYFLIGNLEFLGLPLVGAITVTSVASFTALLLLLYSLATLLTKSPLAGGLTLGFFIFRSSLAVVSYFRQLEPYNPWNIIQTVITNTDYIGTTPGEAWGYWNLNVYVNQRHFIFSLCVLLIILIALVMDHRPQPQIDKS